MRSISKDVRIAAFSTIVGVVVGAIIGYLVSVHFYELSRRHGKEEERVQLLDSAIIDLAHNTLEGNFPHLYDSTGSAESGRPWRKLVTSGVDRLYFNILAFRSHGDFTSFVDLVNEVKLATDDFNDRMSLRNNCILLGEGYVKAHNPRAYHYYQWIVRPKIVNLLDYLRSNYENLVEQ